jgi:hypothetical protein
MKIFKGIVGIVFGFLSAVPLIFGGYLLSIRARTLFGDVYYVDYPYMIVGSGFLIAASVAFWATYYSIKRRTFYGLLLLIPLFAGFATSVIVPDIQPNGNSMRADSNYLSHAGSYLRIWYEDHGRFPSNEAEFAKAMSEGPSHWQPPSPTVESQYRRGGEAIAYQLVVEHDVKGPRLEGLSRRPGTIYYSVNADLRAFWITMSGLNSPFSESAEIKRVADRPDMKPWMVHADGSDYPIQKK